MVKFVSGYPSVFRYCDTAFSDLIQDLFSNGKVKYYDPEKVTYK